MKYQPPIMSELSADQQKLLLALQADEKAQLTTLSVDHDSRQRAEDYRKASSSLLEERGKSEAALVFNAPVTEEEIDEAFKSYEEDSPRVLKAEIVTQIKEVGSTVRKRIFVGVKPVSKHPPANKTRVYKAVHAAVAKSGNKKLTKG